MATNGFKFFRLWKQLKTHRLNHVPLPIWIALTIIKGRYNCKSMEDAIYLIIKRDPETREIIRYVLSGKGEVRLKGEPTVEEEISKADE